MDSNSLWTSVRLVWDKHFWVQNALQVKALKYLLKIGQSTSHFLLRAHKNVHGRWMLIGRMQKQMGLDTQRNVDDTVVIITPFLSNGLSLDVWLSDQCLRVPKMLSSGLVPGQSQSAASSPLSPAWQKAKPAVWNTLGFDTRELELAWALEAWGGLKEDIDLPSWCSAGEQQAMERGSGTCPLLCHSPAVFVWSCELMVVHLLSSSSLKTTQVAYLEEWAIVGAIFSGFCPGGWGTFCYSGIYVKIAW